MSKRKRLPVIWTPRYLPPEVVAANDNAIIQLLAELLKKVAE